MTFDKFFQLTAGVTPPPEPLKPNSDNTLPVTMGNPITSEARISNARTGMTRNLILDMTTPLFINSTIIVPGLGSLVDAMVDSQG